MVFAHQTACEHFAAGSESIDRWAQRSSNARGLLPNTCLNGRLGGTLCYIESGLLLVEFVFVQEGHAESFGMVLYPGDVIPSSILDGQSNIVVRSLTKAHVRLISDGELQASASSTVLLMKRGYGLWERLGRHATVIARMPAEVGFAHLLVELAEHVGRRAGIGCTIDMPMSRAQVASCTGLNPETLSRVITKFKACGLIETQGRRHVHILDWEGLKGLAETRCLDVLSRSPIEQGAAGANRTVGDATSPAERDFELQN